MDGLLRTLIRSRGDGSPGRGNGRSRGRGRRDDNNNNNNHGQIEAILEVLARGLVEYAVRKFVSGHGNSDNDRRDNDRRDNRHRSRNRHDDNERGRGGVPNMDTEMLEHLGRNILSKAVDKFGGGEEGLQDVRPSGYGHGRDGRREGRHGSPSPRDHRDRSRDRDHGDEERGRRRQGEGRQGSPSPGRHREEHRDDPRRRRYGTDYAPLKAELENLSNAIISLNERQPGHADCEFYDAFVERSGKVQQNIGEVLVQIREREARREARREERRRRR